MVAKLLFEISWPSFEFTPVIIGILENLPSARSFLGSSVKNGILHSVDSMVGTKVLICGR